jgi:hypothetical protein
MRLPLDYLNDVPIVVGIMLSTIIFLSCTIEVRPLGYKPPVKKVVHTKHSTKHRKAASEDTMYVSPGWLKEYHEMESEHGGYSISYDHKIQNEGDRVKVPRTVLKHFHDMSKMTPPPSDTPPD